MMTNQSMQRMMMAATKRARVERAMVMAMRVAGDKEGEGDNKKDGIGNEGGVQQRGRDGCKSNSNEDDGRAMATRRMGMAMVTAKATMWVTVMVTRLAGDEEGKGKGSKGNGDDDEGDGQRRRRQVL
jgi:hypothetical protein